jgi:hypothetical protein
MQISHSFQPQAERYKFDDECTYAKGWFQVDTYQDAAYFGIWTHPRKRRIVTYAEGDVTHETYDTDAEYSKAMLRTLIAYEAGSLARQAQPNRKLLRHACIDLGLNGRFMASQRFAELGLAAYTH